MVERGIAPFFAGKFIYVLIVQVFACAILAGMEEPGKPRCRENHGITIDLPVLGC